MKIAILIVCKKCGEIKDISEFYEHKKCRFGVDEICKGCIAERGRIYRKENREKIIKDKKDKYWENPEKNRETSRNYYKNNKEKAKLYGLKHKKRIAELRRLRVNNNRDKYSELDSIQHDKYYFGGNKKKCLERDKYQCQECFTSENLVVHHKDGMGRGVEREQKNNDMDNLITLCNKCHVTLHHAQLRDVQFAPPPS